MAWQILNLLRPNFFFQNELWQRPGRAGECIARTRLWRGVGPWAGAFPGTLSPPPPQPHGQRKDVESPEKPDGSCPEKRSGTSPPRAWEPPPHLRTAGVAAAVNTHRVQRWAGPLGSRTAAPPRCRDGVSARHDSQGHRPARGLEPRGGGGASPPRRGEAAEEQLDRRRV